MEVSSKLMCQWFSICMVEANMRLLVRTRVGPLTSEDDDGIPNLREALAIRERHPLTYIFSPELFVHH
jgi:hypothetical protein